MCSSFIFSLSLLNRSHTHHLPQSYYYYYYSLQYPQRLKKTKRTMTKMRRTRVLLHQ